MFQRALSRYFLSSSSNTLIRPLVVGNLHTTSARHFSQSIRIMAQEFKLKDVTSISSLKNCDKQEAEVEGIEGGKVLIVKVQDKVHALNANCTHFGAPLKNGVVTPEGRITCPWHGGKFESNLAAETF